MANALAASGVTLVGGKEWPGGDDGFRAHDPRSGEETGPVFYTADARAVSAAISHAQAAFARAGGSAPIDALLAVADLLDDHATQIVAQSAVETGLTRERLAGEVARTSGQLRFMAELARRGERLDATIDRADAAAGRPELRRVGMPIGPVAVFGSSNFPIAFSVLGGDTASALAAGCPVLVKAHESHPATSELCGRLMVRALEDCGYDQGWFALLQGRSRALGQGLAGAPQIRAVAFTGSLQGGRALFDAANRRPDPIPVYAEMGSSNPVFVTAAAAKRRGGRIADALAASLTGSAGQLCTKPNLIVLADGPDGEELERVLAAAFAAQPVQPLLNRQVRDGFLASMRAASALEDVVALSAQAGEAGGTRNLALTSSSTSEAEGSFVVGGTLLGASLEALLFHETLRAEHFGPGGVVVRCREEDFTKVAERLEGSLTATIHLETEEALTWSALVALLASKAGRVIVNGVPTGVAVVRAMHHGGPYPATTSARDTSVGAAAIDRFLRPVCFQDVPDALLPPALRDGNPLGIWRRVDGELTGPASAV
ncbi:MAG: aldehyde dehydrogenase (NADP(+)) [Actinomycetota bacterium]|nr:aldehyde dehydrogenase (NADP(+)) [Actinomycetota bacterium]